MLELTLELVEIVVDVELVGVEVELEGTVLGFVGMVAMMVGMVLDCLELEGVVGGMLVVVVLLSRGSIRFTNPHPLEPLNHLQTPRYHLSS